MPNFTPKEIAISNALEEIFQVVGRKIENGVALVRAWVRWLPEVPESHIQRSFDLAMSRGGRSAVPTPERVTEAYRELKKDDVSWNSNDWISMVKLDENGQIRSEERIRRGVYYTYGTFPINLMPERMRYLWERMRDGLLTDAEGWELENLKTQKYYVENVHKEFSPGKYIEST